MKLRHALAGTVALPLALAIASSANAATIVDNDDQTLKIGGFVAAQHAFSLNDAEATEDDHAMSLGTSRLNITHTKKTADGDITIMYENDWAGNKLDKDGDPAGDYRLRHAVIMYDGWVAGQTWSFFSNLNGLGETIEPNGNAVKSAATARNAVVGKNITLAEGMSVGVSLEDRGLSAEDMTPDIAANFKGDFGGIGVFAAVQSYATGADREMRMTGSVAIPAGPATVKAAFTNDVDDMWVSAAAQFKATDSVRANLVVEQAMMDGDNEDYTAIWANAIYTTPVGMEWGAEVGTVSADGTNAPALATGGKADGDMTVRLQARYAF
ncbi:DcaP family trimeric outer membrane transporter [Marinospirillum sp.]|uniref:DcaP family trimeric outer membrane transporter n=1 Tax=Marinospirillum sp. TaxID=2183934 RepID=UPI00384AEFC9